MNIEKELEVLQFQLKKSYEDNNNLKNKFDQEKKVYKDEIDSLKIQVRDLAKRESQKTKQENNQIGKNNNNLM